MGAPYQNGLKPECQIDAVDFGGLFERDGDPEDQVLLGELLDVVKLIFKSFVILLLLLKHFNER